MSEKREKIIKSATRMIRNGGYNAFSFREIAEEVGIKSSSVHHYFRRKEDLAVVVTERYSNTFLGLLGDAAVPDRNPKSVIKHYGKAFLDAFRDSGKACLCGILSHESPAIPRLVLVEIESFIDKNVDWLSIAFGAGPDALNAEDSRKQAHLTYTALSGAMAVATVKNDIHWIESVKSCLEEKIHM